MQWNASGASWFSPIRLSTTPLTGLPNRARFAERLALTMATSERGASLVAVHLCDLDGFKRVNDSFGHAAGDHLLQVVARRLQSWDPPHRRGCHRSRRQGDAPREVEWHASRSGLALAF